uniref:BSD domain-containing protein n=1 Tax=Timema tahoe TaxID=61484 RepID=A0A7R9IFC4_9NEOP|nr:unnamed protein product [Timema tahoe]
MRKQRKNIVGRRKERSEFYQRLKGLLGGLLSGGWGDVTFVGCTDLLLVRTFVTSPPDCASVVWRGSGLEGRKSSLLGEFNKEQEAFIKEKQGKNSDAAVPPWVGCPNENSLKEECLTLSTDRRNFVRSPPAGVEFQFDYEVTYPVAMATLAEDPNLEKMRFELVPKVINEETFWRNYFYRISLIRQANELSSMAESQVSSRINSMEGEPAVINISPFTITSKLMLHSFGCRWAVLFHIVNPRVDDVLSTASDSPAHEFVSDTFRATSSDLEEVREGMKKLGMDPDKRNEEEWEKELEAELQDYEVVADGDGNIHQDSNWENQIDELLDGEHISDLK